MNLQNFESRVLRLWMTTKVPLTRANIQFYTKAPRKKMEAWLDQMVADGVCEVDSDEAGEMIWTVKGADRPVSGTTSVADLEKLDRLSGQGGGGGSSTALALLGGSRGLSSLTQHKPGDKSIVASAALGFFLGPFGLLYAAPLEVAIGAIVAVGVLGAVLGWIPILGALLWKMIAFLVWGPVSAIAAAGYAWRHNQVGERTSLLPPEGRDK